MREPPQKNTGKGKGRGLLHVLAVIAILIVFSGFQNATWAAGEAFCERHLKSLEEIAEPPETENGPVIVEAGIWPIDVTRIDDRERTFLSDFYLTVSWHDERAGFLRWLGAPRDDCIFDADAAFKSGRLWHPGIEFMTRRGDINSRNARLFLSAQGELTYEARLTATFRADFNLRLFPFDRQEFVWALQPYNERDEVVLRPHSEVYGDDSETEITASTENLDLVEWRITDVGIDEAPAQSGDEVYSQLTYRIAATRIPDFYVLQVFLPIFLLVILSGGAFWLAPRETETRVNITVTVLLTLIAFNFIIRDNLPKLAYATLADIFNLISMGFSILAVALVIALHVVHGSGREKLAAGTSAALCVLFPVLYVSVGGGIALAWLTGRF